MHIRDLNVDEEQVISQVARLLMEGFKIDWPDAWPTFEAALAEVHESFGPDRISRVAVDPQQGVLGWVGGIRQYGGTAWELHPLVVQPAHQGKGIGRALVADIEEQVRARGAVTLWLGTDDETNMTSLGGIDLYPDVWKHVASIKNLRRHPFEFYQRLGFVIVGVLPDANGPGKPDLLMAKRVAAL